jgi:hypothetical protein
MSSNWELIKAQKPNGRLIFIHTPKCGGSYASQLTKKFDIQNKGHTQATEEEGKTI